MPCYLLLFLASFLAFVSQAQPAEHPCLEDSSSADIHSGCQKTLEAIRQYKELADQMGKDPAPKAQVDAVMAEVQGLQTRLIQIKKQISELDRTMAQSQDPNISFELGKITNQLNSVTAIKKNLTEHWKEKFLLPSESATRKFLSLSSDPNLPNSLKKKIAAIQSQVKEYFWNPNASTCSLKCSSQSKIPLGRKSWPESSCL